MWITAMTATTATTSSTLRRKIVMKPATTLRMPSGSWPRWLTAAGLLLALALSGCGGSGPAGAAGSSGTNTETGITTGTTLTAVDNAPGIVLTITGVAGQTG